MAIVVVIVLILGLVFLPGIWVKRVMKRYSQPSDRYSGSGAELARHLLDQYELQSVKVEATEHGDHYGHRVRIPLCREVAVENAVDLVRELASALEMEYPVVE